MRIRLFGPLELVRSDGQRVALGSAKRRIVLATLALELNQMVSWDRLMDIVWEGKPPPSAKAALQGHIAQLRKVLGNGVELVTRSPGYQLLADRSLVDVTRFDDLLVEAKSAPDADAVELLRTALGLRRGPVLADVPADRLRAEIAVRLRESEIAAVQHLAERLHRLGRVAEEIDLLRDTVKLQPLREPLVELLMLGLHQAGRQAEALSLYHRTRTLLADDLGVDPSAGLRQAYQTVLAGTADPVVATASDSIPAQLPRENRGFVGRDAELAQLSASRHGYAAIRVLVGPAGVGKTALALRWAHRMDTRFPDGQLFVNLHGFDETEPVEPGTALTGFLRALGVPDARIPADLDERAALYRSMLAHRRMLVVLDNARTTKQVRPLLPGTPGCAVLVSSRNRLDDLMVTEGAINVPVTALSANNAITVLRLIVGAGRIAAEPDAAAELAELCDRLPLALRIAAGRMAGQPQCTVKAMVDELSDERHRLRALSLPDAGVPIHAALSWSYRQLDAEPARLFRLLGLYPATEIDRYAAAALAGTTVGTIRVQLESLTAVHLLHKVGPDRYGRHDLIRLYTTTLAEEEPEAERDTAAARLLDYYLHTADVCRRLVPDIVWPPEMPVTYPPAELPHLSTASAALNWLRTEENNLHNALEVATAREQPGRTWRLALFLERLHFHRGDLARQFTISRTGLAAAKESGDEHAESTFHGRISRILVRLGQTKEAISHSEHALHLGKGDPHSESSALLDLGYCLQAAERLNEAHARLEESITIARTVGNNVLQAYAWNTIACLMQAKGNRAEALKAVHQSRELASDRPLSPVHIATLLTAGRLMCWLGRHNEALSHWDRGLSLARDTGDLHHQAMFHRSIGHVLAQLQDEDAAITHWTQAEKLFTALGAPDVGELRRKLDARISGPGPAHAP